MSELPKIPDESVHTVVTSPPYWQLRDYQVEGQLGLEKNMEEYVSKIVGGFREVRRVLRKDGTLWLNMGDSYASNWPCNRRSVIGQGSIPDGKRKSRPPRMGTGLKEKDLVGMPWMIAFALRADGWYLRTEIIWNKRNCMPESVYDRPTRCHEYVFLLAKSERYFYDAEAIKEPVAGTAHARGSGVNPKADIPTGWDLGKGGHRKLVGRYINRGHDPQHGRRKVKQNKSYSAAVVSLVAFKNKRSVWTIGAQAFKGAHFATFPPKLVEPCILAGTSAWGCCPKCGAPWKRIIEKIAPNAAWKKQCGADSTGEYKGKSQKDYSGAKAQDASETKARILKGMMDKRTVGWTPTCKCGEKTVVPCTVLDPFGGSGTTGEVALKHGRSAVLIELNAEYIPLIHQRLANIQPTFETKL